MAAADAKTKTNKKTLQQFLKYAIGAKDVSYQLYALQGELQRRDNMSLTHIPQNGIKIRKIGILSANPNSWKGVDLKLGPGAVAANGIEHKGFHLGEAKPPQRGYYAEFTTPPTSVILTFQFPEYDHNSTIFDGYSNTKLADGATFKLEVYYDNPAYIAQEQDKLLAKTNAEAKIAAKTAAATAAAKPVAAAKTAAATAAVAAAKPVAAAKTTGTVATRTATTGTATAGTATTETATTGTVAIGTAMTATAAAGTAATAPVEAVVALTAAIATTKIA